MNKYDEIKIGTKFGRLTVIERVKGIKGTYINNYLCKCDCGNIIKESASHLISGHTKSCGCYRKDTYTDYEDLTGKKFNRLTVIKRVDDDFASNGHRIFKYLCRCDCGNEIITTASHLRAGHTKSCGCIRIKAPWRKENPGYRIGGIYRGMIDRCYNPSNMHYKDYGGRGITVCNEWLNKGKDDYSGEETFYNWAITHGYADNLTIDRINVNGNYEPSNCRWVDKDTQANNTRTNNCVTYNGDTFTQADWARIFGYNHSTISRRRIAGYSDEDAITMPCYNTKTNTRNQIEAFYVINSYTNRPIPQSQIDSGDSDQFRTCFK